jgi:hypothetical protein
MPSACRSLTIRPDSGGTQRDGGIPLVILSGYIASRQILRNIGYTLPPSEAGHTS